METKETMTVNYVAVRKAEKTGNVFASVIGNLPRQGRLLNVEVLVDSADASFPLLQKMAEAHVRADEAQDGTLRPRGFGLETAAGFAIGEPTFYKDAVTQVERQGAYVAKPVDGVIELVEASPVKMTISSAAAERLKKLGLV